MLRLGISRRLRPTARPRGVAVVGGDRGAGAVVVFGAPLRNAHVMHAPWQRRFTRECAAYRDAVAVLVHLRHTVSAFSNIGSAGCADEVCCHCLTLAQESLTVKAMIDWMEVARDSIRGIALDPIQEHDAAEVAVFQAIVRGMVNNDAAVARVAAQMQADHERAIRVLLYGDEQE